MVYVTHDQVEAMTLGEQIAVLEGGKLQQVADPQTLYRQPANRFVAGFIGSPAMNFVAAKIESDGRVVVDGAAPFVPATAPAGLGAHRGRAVTLGVRPEDLLTVANGPGARFDAALDVREPLGNEVLLHWNTAAGILTSRMAGAGPEVGERVPLNVPFERLYWFDGTSGAAIL
jgi:multiple sugar transport system ATP-binding protein